MSLETQVNEETPPTFIFHTYEDQAVPAENALLFVSALNKFKIPCEFHLFQKGRHGVGLGTKGNKKWSTLLHDWLIRSGYISE
jgi:dipeptidyl aminopeptidase/acylaminoacyl peptidase